MKITLIPLEELIVAYGIRSMSSLLKSRGFDVSIIFVRATIGKPFSNTMLQQTVELCRDSDVVGISLMSSYFLQAIQLTKALRKRGASLIVWGGIHPTFSPEECLKYADAVCIGEGELSMLELTEKLQKGYEYANTQGIWFSEKGTVIKNDIRPLITNLDELPTQDFGPEKHYIRDKDELKEMNKSSFAQCLTQRQVSKDETVREYYVTTSRGCPYSCSYCASASIKRLYPGQKFYRFRSIEKTIEEVTNLIRKFDFIKSIYFSDDDIFAAPIERIQEFSSAWKQKINLPFYCTCSPWSYTEEKMKLFVNAGLTYINIGIQSVSKRGSDVFCRRVSKERLVSIVNSLSKFNKIIPVYDFIVDNPYETNSDRLENLHFALDISFPREIKVFSLVPYPGSDIYYRYKRDGLLTDETHQIYWKNYGRPKGTYLNFLFYLASRRVPSKGLRILSHEMFLILFNNGVFGPVLFRVSWNCSEVLVLFLAGLRALRHREFYKFGRFLRRKILRKSHALNQSFRKDSC